MMIKLFLLLAVFVAVNNGSKCPVCTSREHGADCDEAHPKFFVECPKGTVCRRSGEVGSVERSCGQLANRGRRNADVHCIKDPNDPTKCQENADPNAEGNRGEGGGSGSSTGASASANPENPSGGSGAEWNNPRKIFNWLYTIILTIFIQFYY